MKKLRYFKKSFIAVFAMLIAAISMTTAVFANPVTATVRDIDDNTFTLGPGLQYLLTTDKPGGYNGDPSYVGIYYIGLWHLTQPTDFDNSQNDIESYIGYIDEGLTVRNVVFSHEFGGSDFVATPNKDYYVVAGPTSMEVRDGGTVVFQSTSRRIYIRTLELDNQRPAIDGQENFVTSVDNPITVNEIQDYLTAWDETDGDLTDDIYIITDNYTPNKLVLGKHSIVFGVEDAAGNEATVEVFVNVVDITDPVITGNSTKAQISYTKTWNINNFKSTLVATDNYDTLTNADIYIVSDNYTNNKTKLGTYSIVFGVEDASGNETTFTKKVEVIDDVAPVINGPTTLTKPITSTLTINDIKQQLTATDEKDGNVNASLVVITDNFTGKGNITGTYTIVFEASDSKGNKATHTVTVQVIDNIAPIFYIKDGVSIVLSPGVELTRQQIIDLLIASDQLPVGGTTTFSFPIDNYTGNEETPGVYPMQIMARSTNGNEYLHNFAITVMEAEDDDPIVIDEPTNWLGWWDDTIEWVEENPYIAGGIGIGVLALIGLLIYASKRKPKNKRRRRK